MFDTCLNLSEGNRRARQRIEERRSEHERQGSVSKEKKQTCDGGPSPGKNVSDCSTNKTKSFPSKEAGHQNWFEVRDKVRGQHQDKNWQFVQPRAAEMPPQQERHQQSVQRNLAETHHGFFQPPHQKPANFDHTMHLNPPNFEGHHQQHWHPQQQNWFQPQQQQFAQPPPPGQQQFAQQQQQGCIFQRNISLLRKLKTSAIKSNSIINRNKAAL